MKLDLRQIKFGSAEHELEIQLRTKVLREPLGLRFSDEELARERDEIHLGAFSERGLLGCLVLSPVSKTVIKMRQVAVDSTAQGLGVGKQLVTYSEKLAVELGFEEMVLHARETAVRFYLSQGYEVYDKPFEEVTIPHRKMRKVLHFHGRK